VIKWLGDLLCRLGIHKWVHCTIKWQDGGPWLGWHMCDRCDLILPVKGGDQWRPFTVEKDSRKPEPPKPGLQFPVKSPAVRQTLAREDTCPECGGELDTGWECLDCHFDAELLAYSAQERRLDQMTG